MASKKKAPAPKRGASRYQAPAKKPVPIWVWLGCFLLVGGFLMFLAQLQPGRDGIKRDKPEQASTASKAKPPVAKPVAPKPTYDFYTLLPESKVIVPSDGLTSTAKPVSPEEAAKIDAARAEALLNGKTPPPAPIIAKAPTSTALFLQAGAFRKRADADKLRAQIILLGQDVQIESGTVREEVWYRVLAGPFADREQLAKAQKSLAGSGFSNLLLQQRPAN